MSPMDQLERPEGVHMSLFLAYAAQREPLDDQQIKNPLDWKALA